MKILFFTDFIARLNNRRVDRVEALEREIDTLERLRDTQADEIATMRRNAEDERRALKLSAENDVRKLQQQIENLTEKAKRIDEDTRHLVKMKEQKLDIEHERKLIELERKTNDAIAKNAAEFQTKVEKMLTEQITKLDGQYTALLARLPDINVALKGRIGGE